MCLLFNGFIELNWIDLIWFWYAYLNCVETQRPQQVPWEARATEAWGELHHPTTEGVRTIRKAITTTITTTIIMRITTPSLQLLRTRRTIVRRGEVGLHREAAKQRWRHRWSGRRSSWLLWPTKRKKRTSWQSKGQNCLRDPRKEQSSFNAPSM